VSIFWPQIYTDYFRVQVAGYRWQVKSTLFTGFRGYP